MFMASAKIPEREASISLSTFYEPPPDYKSRAFCLFYQVDEVSLKEMRT